MLEGALLRGGRDDLLPAVSAVGRLLGVLTKSDAAATELDEAMALVGRTLARVRQCVMDRGLVFDSALLGEVDAMCRRFAPRPEGSFASLVPVPEPPPMRGAPPQSGIVDGEALNLMATLADADDGDLDQLVESVGKIQKVAPTDALGTLREPIVGMRKPEASARVLMKGELHPGLLSDLMQLFAQNTETGRLVIEGGGTVANVYFAEGKIVDAECGKETGEKAFFLAMLVREGRFSYQRGVEAPAPRIFRSAQHLIMDTLRLMDEST
jgi:hypothetical protein